ncbi:MAG TPA: hypothetical protein GX707_12280 [Epulopiscium sp.]|nr:hypothetical protein [Candidatus Epulonipiscium sp.]
MQKLLDYGNEFLQQSTWKDLALIKVCLLAMGIICGIEIPKKAHKPVAFIAILAFIMTYVPLMIKLFKIMDENASSEME